MRFEMAAGREGGYIVEADSRESAVATFEALLLCGEFGVLALEQATKCKGGLRVRVIREVS